jgi:hypothetical protein
MDCLQNRRDLPLRTWLAFSQTKFESPDFASHFHPADFRNPRPPAIDTRYPASKYMLSFYNETSTAIFFAEHLRIVGAP